MIYSVTPERLTRVFGDDSRGDTLEERALTSSRMYVRSQTQLAEYAAGATGRRLTAPEALLIFGIDVLEQVALEGAFPLVNDISEPAATIKRRREELGITPEKLAAAAGVARERAAVAETPGEISPIRELERLAQALALDERVLSYQPGAGADRELGVRLREFAYPQDHGHFSEASVLALSEAAWVIGRQSLMMAALRKSIDVRSCFGITPDSNYSYPAYSQGTRLASTTRAALGLSDEEPVPSLRTLIEDRLGIPLIVQQLDDRFAGATIANGISRGIVANERGRNDNVWVRRMTLCHELAHLLWDPDSRLNRLVVDDYDAVEGKMRANPDPVEIRANSFAVSFLAPPKAVLKQIQATTSPITATACIMEKFGISATAAKWHVKNVTHVDITSTSARELPRPSDEWLAQENLMVDYFPLGDTPISRRGRFATLVAMAFQAGLISSDTGAMYLRTDREKFEASFNSILELSGVPA
jgi:Zn-dependent peptidase ImmA (M78 family)/transcriptional regulator with XRE-family HTH domain